MPYLAQKQDCLVYSVGSALNDAFEQDVLKWAPHCEVHTFDPTVDPVQAEAMARTGGYSFHSEGVSGKQTSGSTLKHGLLHTLNEIRASLGHTGRTLDILKIDCEGCEWEALGELFELCGGPDEFPINQIQVELHGIHEPESYRNHYPKIKHFFDGADKCGLLIFHKERNSWGCNGYACLEYSLVQQTWATTVFHQAYCPYTYLPPSSPHFALASP
ncbi:unnamed protein product [Chrysoparadoxa australica]